MLEMMDNTFVLIGVYFNRQSTCLWVLTVLLVRPTSFIRKRQTWYRPICRKTKTS